MVLNLLAGQIEIIDFLLLILALVVGITVHEFSHALAATLQGDKTAQYAGRLTLNPFSHLDPFGALLIILVGFGYGRPVPFNPYNLRNKQYGPAIVGMAGPLSNLLLVVIFGILLKVLFPVLTGSNLLVVFLGILIQANLILLVFNLFPIPPLDGSKVLFAILPSNMSDVKIFLEQYGPWLLLGLLLFGRGIIGVVFKFFLDITYRFIT